MTMAITITESAAKHVASQLSRRGKGIGLRLGVRTSGCSGLAYKIEFADERKPEDISFEAHGVTVHVDKKSMRVLQGVTLDYKVGLLDAGFRFENPRATKTCGCGESFAL